ncbi:MAG: hypothetical protein ACTSQI_19900 [Candidatus Helarchaeota archaeon]
MKRYFTRSILRKNLAKGVLKGFAVAVVKLYLNGKRDQLVNFKKQYSSYVHFLFRVLKLL